MTETLQPQFEAPQYFDPRLFIEQAFHITDPQAQDLIMSEFDMEAVKSHYDLGLIPFWTPYGALRYKLISQGIPNPEEIYPFLKNA